MEEYLIRRVSGQRYKDICYLFKERGGGYSEEFVRKKFDTGFTGQKDIGYLAYHAATGEPASHYSVFPCFIVANGKKILAAQSGDTITHKRHQRKGLFIRLAEKCYALAKESGIELIFGFPNQNSYHGFIDKLNWIYSESMLAFIIEVHGFPLYKIASRLPAGSTLYHSFLKSLATAKNPKHNLPENSILSEGFGGVVHDADFFKYKTYTRNYIVRIEGVVIWFKVGNGIYVGDIQPGAVYDGERILFALKKLARQTGNSRVVIPTSHGTRLEEFLSGHLTGTPVASACWLNLSTNFSAGSLKFTAGDWDTF